MISCCSMPSPNLCPACHPRNLLCKLFVRVNEVHLPLLGHFPHICFARFFLDTQADRKTWQAISKHQYLYFLRPCLVATFFGTRLKGLNFDWKKPLQHPFLNMPQRTHTMAFHVTWLAFWMCCLALSSSCSPLNSFRSKVPKNCEDFLKQGKDSNDLLWLADLL